MSFLFFGENMPSQCVEIVTGNYFFQIEPERSHGADREDGKAFGMRDVEVEIRNFGATILSLGKDEFSRLEPEVAAEDFPFTSLSDEVTALIFLEAVTLSSFDFTIRERQLRKEELLVRNVPEVDLLGARGMGERAQGDRWLGLFVED